MNDPLLIFMFFGTGAFILQTIKDIRQRLIDDRRNVFMIGLIVALVLVTKMNYLYFVLILISCSVIGYLMQRYNIWAKGDTSLFRWSAAGFYLFGYISIIKFTAILFFLLAGLLLINRLLVKKQGNVKIPAAPFFLAAFLITGLWYFFF